MIDRNSTGMQNRDKQQSTAKEIVVRCEVMVADLKSSKFGSK